MTELSLNQIICGDCLEVLPRFPSESIDFILTDPPFNVGLKYKSIGDEKDDEEYSKWCLQWLSEINRVLKFNHYAIVFTGDKKSFWVFSAIYKSGLTFHHFLKWYKPSCERALSGTVLFSRTELAFVCSKGKPNIDLINRKRLFQDTLIYQNTNSSEIDSVDHNARRPIPLYEHIIEGFTNENDIVLDCFLGTGTTALACQNLKRNFIGIEIDSEYVAISKKRLSENQKSKPKPLESF